MSEFLVLREMREGKKDLFSQRTNVVMAKTSKIKPLLPSLREKKRYVAFEILAERKLDSYGNITKAILQQCHQFMGDLNYSNAGLMMLPDKFNKEKQKGIMKVSHKYVDHVKASFALIKTIQDQPVIVASLGTSGILKKAEEKWLS